MGDQQVEQKRGRLRSCACLGSLGALTSLALAIILAVVGVYFALTAAGALLIIADPLQKSDAAVVLSGGGGERVDEAIRIYQEKKAEYIVFTHPDREGGGWESHLMDMKLQSIHGGVPITGLLVTDEHGNSTYEEAKEIRRYLEPMKFKSILVVTDPFHTFRTRLIFREVFKDSSIQVRVRPVRGHWYRSSSWWMSGQGWQMTVEEYFKIGAFLAGIRSD